jgi:phage terminase large subunit-like protein
MSKPKPRPARARRITIDERLDEGLLKIAIADLLPGHKELGDDPLDAWSNETVRLIGQDDLLPMLELATDDPLVRHLAGDPPAEVGEDALVGVIWRSLEEGQVYIAGEVEVETAEPPAPTSIVARPGSWTVLRVDRIEGIKKKHEALYSKALRGGR